MNCGLLVKGSCGWRSNICPHDLDQLYLQGMGYLPWLKLLTSVRECDIDYMRHISEIMEEYCMDAMGRSAMETHLRMTHKRVNDERSARSRQVSAHERYLKMFFDRQAVRRGAEHAPAMEARL